MRRQSYAHGGSCTSAVCLLLHREKYEEVWRPAGNASQHTTGHQCCHQARASDNASRTVDGGVQVWEPVRRGVIWACRDVDELAELLGPLLAPLVSKAVNLASAAFVARTLARPAIPVSNFAEASLACSGAAATSWSADRARRGPTNPEQAFGSRLTPLRRSATASWVLSEGYELLKCKGLSESRTMLPGQINTGTTAMPSVPWLCILVMP